MICDHTEYRNYLCYEHTTYLFGFSEAWGPAWFTVPGDKQIFPEADGTMNFLWDFFDEWLEDRNDRI